MAGVEHDDAVTRRLKVQVRAEDRIENLPNQTLILSSPENLALYKDFFIAAPQPAAFGQRRYCR